MTTQEKAIEQLERISSRLASIGEKEDYTDVEIQALEQTRWIPCSERTPEDRREVLVTAYWHETYQVMMASYFGDGLWWCVPFNNSGNICRD